jgi:hypothetical protein
MKAGFSESWAWFVESIHKYDEGLFFSPFDSNKTTEYWIESCGNSLILLLIKDIGFNKKTATNTLCEKIQKHKYVYLYFANKIDNALIDYSKYPFRRMKTGPLNSRKDSLSDLLSLPKIHTYELIEAPPLLYSEKRYPELHSITHRQQYLICGIGYLYDAYLAKNLNLIDDAMCYLSGAVAQASEVDIKELSQQLKTTAPKAIAFDTRQARKKEAVVKGGKIRGLQKKHEGALSADLIIHLYHQIRLSPKYKDKSANHLRGIVGDIIDSPENVSRLCRSSIYSILRVANLPYGSNKLTT